MLPDRWMRTATSRPSARANTAASSELPVRIEMGCRTMVSPPDPPRAFLIRACRWAPEYTLPCILHEHASRALRLLQVVAGHAFDGIAACPVVELDLERSALKWRVGPQSCDQAHVPGAEPGDDGHLGAVRSRRE